MTANQVVSYRLREARQRRGWTQAEAGERLAPYLGARLSPASFSAAERSVDGLMVREFTANEIVAFARAFEVPALLFLVPPPGVRLACSDGGADGLDGSVLVDAVLGTPETFPLFEERLLAWSAELGRRGACPGQVSPWLGTYLRDAAARVFGSTRDCADALTRAAALLSALDDGSVDA